MSTNREAVKFISGSSRYSAAINENEVDVYTPMWKDHLTKESKACIN